MFDVNYVVFTSSDFWDGILPVSDFLIRSLVFTFGVTWLLLCREGYCAEFLFGGVDSKVGDYVC